MKIPNPQKLPSGNWRIKLRLGGETISITRSSDKEAIKEARLIKAEYLAGKRTTPVEVPAPPPTLTACIDAYIERRKNSLSPSTIDGYRRIQRNRFKSVMNQPVSADWDWKKLCDDELANCSAKTLSNAFGFIKSVLRDAKLERPEVKLAKGKSNIREWLDYDEVLKLIDVADGTDAALPVFFALHSLRRSEILALDWDDIDLKDSIIHVNKAIVQNEHHKFVERDENKTPDSTREIPIMIPQLLVLLTSTPPEDRNGHVVTCAPHTISKRINAACARAGLKEVGTHGLRHSFASLAYHLGWSALQTQETGGWSDSNTVHKIYTHIAKKDRLKAHNSMKEFFGFTIPGGENGHENGHEKEKSA